MEEANVIAGEAGALQLGLSQQTLILLWIGIAAYLALMLFIGFRCSRRIKDMSDFLVAGRRLPLWMATATLLATWFGAGSSMGVAAEVYADGLGGVIADPFGASLSLLLAGIFIVGMLRRAECLTVTDIVSRRYGRWAGIYTSLWMVPVYIGWLGSQMMGLGTLLNLLTGLDIRLGMMIGAVVVLCYTMTGGMWAVTLTDIVQVVLIVFGLLLIVPGAIHEAGGWQTLLDRIPAAERTLAPGPEVAGLRGWSAYIGSWIVMGLGCMVGQDLVQRSLASRSGKIAASSSVMAGFLYLALAMIPVTIGFAARPVFAARGIELSGDLENQVLPNMAILILNRLNPLVLVIFLSALISAIMSSADSSLLAGTSLLVNNVIRPARPSLSDRALLRIARVTTVVMTAVALFLALKMSSIYKLMVNSWCSQLVIVFVPVVTALYVKKASKICAWACLAVSTVVWLGYVLFDAGGLRAALGKLADDDVSLTCGAVYGFAAGLIAFFVIYFVELVTHRHSGGTTTKCRRN